MRRLGIGISALLAFAAFAATTPVGAHAAKAPSKVKVLTWFPFGPPPSGFWQVRVKSDVNQCQKERFVEFYQRAGKENVLLGSGTTAKQGSGKWIWEFFSPEPENGDYFALAPPTQKCKRSESKIFTYPDDN